MINNFDAINNVNNELKNCNLSKHFESEEKKISTTDQSLENEVTSEMNPNLDDSGREYRNESGELLPNNKFTIGEHTFSTDDNGVIYNIDGKHVPYNNYELKGVTYATDGLGRITSWKCNESLKLNPENIRDSKAQAEVGGKDRLPGDDGSHLIACLLGGDSGIGNQIALRGVINRGDWKIDENTIVGLIKNGNDVRMEGKIHYDGNSERPSKIETSIYSNGDKISEAIYDNNVGSKDLLENVKDSLTPDDYKNLCDEISQLEKNGDKVSITSVTFKPGEDPSIAVRNETTEKTCYWPWNTRNEGKTLSDVFHNS